MGLVDLELKILLFRSEAAGSKYLKYKVIRFRSMDKSGERARSSARIERRPSIPGVGESRRSGVRIPAGPPLFRAPDDAAF
jgi:lipopolysaccharide/colanic/teichoic acid biosynthesis glycosyltransferase